MKKLSFFGKSYFKINKSQLMLVKIIKKVHYGYIKKILPALFDWSIIG